MRLILVIFFLWTFSSCSDFEGKIELRKSKNSCLSIPSELPPQIDSSYAITDTIAAKRQAEKDNYWHQKEINLKNLLTKKKFYEDEASQVYLINTSKSEVFTFTVKIMLDDSSKTSMTKMYKANPGEEIFIGCNSNLTDDMSLLRQTFKIVGQKK